MTDRLEQMKTAVANATAAGDYQSAAAISKAYKEATKTYTPTTVKEDPEALKKIRAYMYSFEGVDENTPDDEVTAMFTNKMRKFSSGNSITTVNELYNLSKADPEKLAIAGQAYDTFDRFSGAFSDDYTWAETGDAVLDYAGSVVLDPTNLVGLGVGKAAATVGTKSTSALLKAAAKKAGLEAVERALIPQVGAKAAGKIAAEGLTGPLATAALKKPAIALATQAERAAAQKAIQEAAISAPVKAAAKKGLMVEIGTATAVDGALAVGVDYAYQSGLIMAGNKEEYSTFQGGLTALGALGGGLLSAGLSLTNKAVYKGLDNEAARLSTRLADVNIRKVVAKDAAQKMDQAKFMGDMETLFTTFKERVAAGYDITGANRPVRGVGEKDFFKYLILGNDQLGVKGLAQAAHEAGVTITGPRYAGDNVTSFIADIVAELPQDQINRFNQLFRENVSTSLPDYKDFKAEDLANILSYQTSVAGQTLNIQSQVSKIFKAANVDPETGTIGDALDILNPAVVGRQPKAGEPSKLARNIGYFQSTLIQTIVAHPGTTALNIKGGLQMGVLTTASDIVQGALYTGMGMAGLAKGDTKLLKRGVQLFRLQGRRVANLVAPDATYNDAMSYLAMRPEAEKTLFRFLSGGVENMEMAKQFGLDPNKPYIKGIETYKYWAQKFFLVQEQDRFFKTQNFMYFLDRNIREKYGVTYKQFLDDPALAQKMVSEEYGAIELKAVDDTLKSVFSKSYSSRETISHNPIHWAATTIEEVRKVPIIGATMPFGQFFNNTMDMLSDYTGVKLIYRLAGFGDGRSVEALTDAGIKAAVGAGAVFTMLPEEEENINTGLAWNEERNSDGSISSKEYDFPESFFKMLAHGVAYHKRDGNVPPELVEQFASTFTIESFTRQIGKTGGDVAGAFSAMTEEGGFLKGVKTLANVLATNVGSAWASGFTRPLDPVNQLVGSFKEGGPKALDRDTGWKIVNKSLSYVDQVFTPMLEMLGAKEAQNVANKTEIPTIGKLIGMRTTPAQSPTQKMLNSINMPEWKANVDTGDPNLDNRLNEIIGEEIEKAAATLLNTKNWEKLSADQKRASVRDTLNKARKNAIRQLTLSPAVEDAKLGALANLYDAGSQKDIQRAMKSLGLEGEVDELSPYQINQLAIEVKATKPKDLLRPY